ncbi:MAG: HAD hydrolase-like protein, partial [Planctomycetota bacterium]
SKKLTSAAADACFAKTAQLLGLPIQEVVYCPHQAFPAGCFCRKPQPGMGVYLMRKHRLSPQDLIMVGDMKSDEGFAEAIGAAFHHADQFFA